MVAIVTLPFIYRKSILDKLLVGSRKSSVGCRPVCGDYKTQLCVGVLHSVPDAIEKRVETTSEHIIGISVHKQSSFERYVSYSRVKVKSHQTSLTPMISEELFGFSHASVECSVHKFEPNFLVMRQIYHNTC